jgi:hypothetical protein
MLKIDDMPPTPLEKSKMYLPKCYWPLHAQHRLRKILRNPASGFRGHMFQHNQRRNPLVNRI